MTTAPLVVAVHGPANTVLWVQDGCVWLLDGAVWRELHRADVAPGLGGHVLTRAQVEALAARVGRPL